MFNYKNITEVNKSFVEIRDKLSLSELEKLTGFKSKKDKILSLFSIRFKDIKKLLYQGSLTYCFIFKYEYFINKNGNFYKCWCLFSPSISFEENPEKYNKIAAELNSFLENPPKQYKRVVKKITLKENDFSFFELSENVFNEKLFLCTTYLKESTNPNLKLGVNFCLLNRKISKTLLILPEFFVDKF